MLKNAMMLKPGQWAQIEELLRDTPVGRASNNRLFVEAVLYRAKTGCPWRALTPHWGNWHSIYVRFLRWEAYGMWDAIFQIVRGDPEFEGLFVDRSFMGSPRQYTTSGHSGGKTLGMARRIR